MKNKYFKKNWQVKIYAIWKLLFTKKYMLLSFERVNRDNGYVLGIFSKGFTEIQRNEFLDHAQITFRENIVADNFESVVNEANQILK